MLAQPGAIGGALGVPTGTRPANPGYGAKTSNAWSAPASLALLGGSKGSVMATVGKTVYIVYQDTSNNLQFKVSTDEGLTFGAAVAVTSDGAQNNVPLDQAFFVDKLTGTMHLFGVKHEDQGSQPCALYYYRSTNGGTTWSAGSLIDDGTAHGNNRFYRIAAVANAGNSYLAYTSISAVDYTTDGLFFAKSTDDGVTWPTPTQPFSATAVSPSRPFMAMVGTTLHVAWCDRRHGSFGFGGNGESYYGRSTDSGATWAERRMTYSANTRTPAAGSTLRPTLIADATPSGSAVTYCWQDMNGTIGAGSPTGANVLYYQNSQDGGATWGPTIWMASDGTFDAEHAYLAQSGSQVYCVWADYRYKRNAGNASAFARFSSDGGATFGPEQLVGGPDADAPGSLYTTDYAIVFYAQTSANNFYLTRRSIIPTPRNTVPLDNAQRVNAGPPPSANWSQGPLDFTAGEGLVVLNSMLAKKASGSFRQDDYWNPQKFGPDCEVWATIGLASATASDQVALWLRGATSGGVTTNSNGYYLNISSGGRQNITLSRMTGGVNTTLGSLITQSVSTGDTFLLRAVGTQIEVWYKAAALGPWTLLTSVTDSTYSASGYVGLGLATTAQALQISAFGGGATGGTPSGSATMSATLAATLTGSVKRSGPVSIAAVVNTTATGIVKRAGAASLTATVGTSPTGIVKRAGAASLASTMSATIAAGIKRAGLVGVTASFTLAASGLRSTGTSVSMNAILALTATGSTTSRTPTTVVWQVVSVVVPPLAVYPITVE